MHGCSEFPPVPTPASLAALRSDRPLFHLGRLPPIFSRLSHTKHSLVGPSPCGNCPACWQVSKDPNGLGLGHAPPQAELRILYLHTGFDPSAPAPTRPRACRCPARAGLALAALLLALAQPARAAQEDTPVSELAWHDGMLFFGGALRKTVPPNTTATGLDVASQAVGSETLEGPARR